MLAASPAFAEHHEESEQQETPLAEVVERDEDGRAIRIRVEGREYDVCGEGQQDGCINPREAGLGFGTVPIDQWPGQPASTLEEGEKKDEERR